MISAAADTVYALNEYEAAILGTAITFTILASVSVILRILSKRLTGSPFGLDDWSSFLAFACFLTAETLVIRGDLVGRAAVEETATDPAFEAYTIYTFTQSAFYYAVVALCLASILFLYKRLFVGRKVQWGILCMQLIVYAWGIEAIVIETFGSRPFVPIPHDPTNYSWHVDYLPWWLANGIIELILTLVSISIPVVQVYSLHMSRKKRALLCLVFVVSGLCLLTGILRLALLYNTPSDKGAINLALGDIFLTCHLGTAIMSANLPLCWPIISRRSELPSVLSWRSRSLATATSATVHMDDLSLPRKLSAAHLRERDDQLFDPRGATTWAEAHGVAGSGSQVETFDHAPALLEEGTITVTKTVDVRRSS